MKLSKYISDTHAVNNLYEDMDFLNLVFCAQEASKPWIIRRTIANDDFPSRVNLMLDYFDKGKTEALQRVQKNINRLFKSTFKKYFMEEFGLDNGAEVSIVYGEDKLEMSVFTAKIIISYTSPVDMIDKVLNYDTTNLFNHKIFQFISTLYGMSGTDDGVWVDIKRNGAAILCTSDGLSIKIKHSFHNELKYIMSKSTGVRKENLSRALAILER